jgi:hypothetical protein
MDEKQNSPGRRRAVNAAKRQRVAGMRSYKTMRKQGGAPVGQHTADNRIYHRVRRAGSSRNPVADAKKHGPKVF